MMASAGSILYYVAQWSDEIMPCAPTLEGWAEWLSKPDEQWNRSEPAVDGERFETSVMQMGADVIATRNEDGWKFSDEPKADFFAIRWGPGLRWDADSISGDLESLQESLDDGDDQPVYIAVGFNKPSVTLVFHAGPPARCSIEPLVSPVPH